MTPYDSWSSSMESENDEHNMAMDVMKQPVIMDTLWLNLFEMKDPNGAENQRYKIASINWSL